MAGDIGIREKAVILPEAGSLAAEAAIPGLPGGVKHVYGFRVMVVEVPEEAGAEALAAPGAAMVEDAASVPADVLASLSLPEQLGLQALSLRQSASYVAAKAVRPHDGRHWDSSVADQPACHDITLADSAEALAPAGAPTSARLTGSIAVGIIIVEGPTAALTFSSAERTKVVAEVQNGLGWLASQSPEGITFKYDIHVVTLATPPGPSSLDSGQKEALWRDPAMVKLGFAPDMTGVTAYVEKLRTTLGTTWAYCGFFTKYPLGWFAYASIGGPRLVMDYANDGWGPDNIDRVFAHESGHIFGAPDEYAASGCNCGGSWGFYGRPNTNCANCAPSGGVDCLMKGNSWTMCDQTPYHLGFPLVDQRYSGVWRQGNDAYYLWANASWNSFVAKWQQLGAQNLRLVDLKITRTGNDERFHGVWRQGTGGYYLWVNADWNSFVTKWQQLAGQGLRLVDIEVQNVNGTLLYSGVWLPGTDGYYLWANADWNSFVAKWQELGPQNLRLIDIKIVNVGNQQRFFGVWRQGAGAYYLWVNADWANFTAKWQQLGQQGLRLVDIEITQTPQGQRFSGVWLPGTDAYYLWVGADFQHFRAKWEELAGQGLRLIDLDVTGPGIAQSPTPSSASAPAMSSLQAGAGYAAAQASSDGDDGMGGGSDSANDATASGRGYGGGNLETATGAEAGIAGMGEGSLAGATLAGPTESAGVGGGHASGGAPTLSATGLEGRGGGSEA